MPHASAAGVHTLIQDSASCCCIKLSSCSYRKNSLWFVQELMTRNHVLVSPCSVPSCSAQSLITDHWSLLLFTSSFISSIDFIMMPPCTICLLVSPLLSALPVPASNHHSVLLYSYSSCSSCSSSHQQHHHPHPQHHSIYYLMLTSQHVMILTPRTQKFNSSISTVLHLVLLLLYLLISSCFSLLSLTPSSSTITTSSSSASLLLLVFLYDLTQQPSASPTISNKSHNYHHQWQEGAKDEMRRCSR